MGRDRHIARVFASVLVWLGMASTVPAAAYEGSLHQQFTFSAARYLNRCLEGTSIAPLAPLDVRYVARANVAEADTGWFGWMYRSDFYDRAGQAEKTWMWVLDSRVHDRFRDSVRDLNRAAAARERYTALGRILNALQNMTSPAHVVPVYFARWWRLNISDRFDGYPIDVDAIDASLEDDCAALLGADDDSLEALMIETASDTLRAVQRPIEGLPASWQAFWTLAANPEDFGEYGPAGNSFGKRVEFDCQSTRCVLLDRDPLYRAFAMERHRLAVSTTARALLMVQRRLGDEADHAIVATEE